MKAYLTLVFTRQRDTPILLKDTPFLLEDTPLLLEDTPLLLEDTPLLLEDTPLLLEGTPLLLEDKKGARGELVVGFWSDCGQEDGGGGVGLPCYAYIRDSWRLGCTLW